MAGLRGQSDLDALDRLALASVAITKAALQPSIAAARGHGIPAGPCSYGARIRCRASSAAIAWSPRKGRSRNVYA